MNRQRTVGMYRQGRAAYAPSAIPKAPNHGECTFLQYWKMLSPPLIEAACGNSLEGKRLQQSFVIIPDQVTTDKRDQYCFGPRASWHADFAFADAKLFIEIDGGQKGNNPHQVHNNTFEADRERDNWCTEHGFAVLRYTMAAMDNPDAVIGQVVRTIRGRL